MVSVVDKVYEGHILIMRHTNLNVILYIYYV